MENNKPGQNLFQHNTASIQVIELFNSRTLFSLYTNRSSCQIGVGQSRYPLLLWCRVGLLLVLVLALSVFGLVIPTVGSLYFALAILFLIQYEFEKIARLEKYPCDQKCIEELGAIAHRTRPGSLSIIPEKGLLQPQINQPPHLALTIEEWTNTLQCAVN